MSDGGSNDADVTYGRKRTVGWRQLPRDGIDSVAGRGASTTATKRVPRELHVVTDHYVPRTETLLRKSSCFYLFIYLFFFTSRNDHRDHKTS